MILACVDGGLFCGPLLYFLLVTLLGWLGWKRKRCAESGCEHKCGEEHKTGTVNPGH